MTDYLSSFFENIKGKLSNPFFGTFVLVLIMYHWELWYSIINFDEGVSLKDKLEFISDMVRVEFSWWELGRDITRAVNITLFGYLILVVSRFLSMWIEFRLMPNITERVISKKIVLRDDHEKVVTERDKYFGEYEKRNATYIQLSENFESQSQLLKNREESHIDLTKKYQAANDELADLKSQLSDLSTVIVDFTKKESQLQKSLDYYIEQANDLERKSSLLEALFLKQPNLPFWDALDKFPPGIINVVNEMKKNNDWNSLMSIGRHIERARSGMVSTISTHHYDKLKKYGIVEDGQRDELTPLGKIIYEYRDILAANPPSQPYTVITE